MALGATIYKAKLDISDLERHYYAEHALTIACHPSETDLRLSARLLAFMANADDALTMTRGLSSDDEPDLWRHAPDGRIACWIELGEPSLKRIKQGLSRADEVIVYAYTARSAEQWWKKLGDDVRALSRVTVWYLPETTLQSLAALMERYMRLGATLMEGEWLITDGRESVTLTPERWI